MTRIPAAAGPHGVPFKIGVTRSVQSALKTMAALTIVKMAGATG